MEKKLITAIENEGTIEKKSEKPIRRVAAYCRVSTLQDEQELSYESQCEYFQRLIQSRADMELVDVYGDQGLSGLIAEKRPELQRMLADARDGKIDLIIVKSISRLSRNTIDLQKIVDEMKELGISIEFEKEGLQSDDPQFELVLKFLASVAQEESNSISQAISWSHQRNNRMGKPTRNCAYGFRKKPREKGDPHVWEIYEPEAELVRLAFSMKLKGATLADIGKALRKKQAGLPEESQRKWHSSTVKGLLENEAYMGDLLTSKTFIPDYLTKKAKKNNGEREQFYLENHHPAIVKKKDFEKVGKLLERETEERRARNGNR